MGREPEERQGDEADPDETERVEPRGDSAGVYEISIAEFEGRLPRRNPPEPRERA